MIIYNCTCDLMSACDYVLMNVLYVSMLVYCILYFVLVYCPVLIYWRISHKKQGMLSQWPAPDHMGWARVYRVDVL